jgi:single-strand DNA-binding protein
MAELELPKLAVRVRFPSPAPPKAQVTSLLPTCRSPAVDRRALYVPSQRAACRCSPREPVHPTNLTDDPELRHTESGIARARFRVAVSGRRKQEASFFTVILWRDQAEHAAESLAKGSRVVVVGRLQQRAWTAEDGSARQVVEVVAEELGPGLRWATPTTTRATRSPSQ